MDKGQIEKGHCSWCFAPDPTPHVLEKRNVYHCEGCFKRTNKCKESGCSDFARAYAGGVSDDKCYVHQNLITKWNGGQTRDALASTRVCSWCLEKGLQDLVHNKKKLYCCRNCGNEGLVCVNNCTESLARTKGNIGASALGGGSLTGSPKCLKCAGFVKDWSDLAEIQKKLTVTAWCSACYEKCTHCLMDKNLVRRDEYCCSMCLTPTMKCLKCKDAMSLSGPTHPSCSQCGSSTWKWETIAAKKNSFLTEMDIKTISNNLSNPTQQRAAMEKIGMLRPYLLLVSMHPAARCQIASSLDIQLLSCAEFGDPHSEALFIIEKGMLPPARKGSESVTRQAPDWYSIIFRVHKASFKENSIGAEPDKTSITTSNSKHLPIEEMFMDVLARQALGSLSGDRAAALDKMASSPQYPTFVARLKKHGLSSTNVVRWMLDILLSSTCAEDEAVDARPENLMDNLNDVMRDQMLRGKGYFSTKNNSKKSLGNAAVSGGLLAAHIAIMPICPPLGLALTAVSVTRLVSKALSPDYLLLLPTLTQIILQRLFLACCDISIDNFY